MRSLSSMVESLASGLSSRAGRSEKWHSDSLLLCLQIVHGCSPLHFCFRRLQLSQARRHRSRAPGVVLARGIVSGEGSGVSSGHRVIEREKSRSCQTATCGSSWHVGRRNLCSREGLSNIETPEVNAATLSSPKYRPCPKSRLAGTPTAQSGCGLQTG